jgi:hypothetical protein
VQKENIVAKLIAGFKRAVTEAVTPRGLRKTEIKSIFY